MNKRVTILHTNDLHAEYDQWVKCVGIIKERRTALGADAVLVVDCGDHCDMSETLCSLSGGLIHAELLSESGCEAFVPGNNEMYRLPLDKINALASRCSFPWVLTTVAGTEKSSLTNVRASIQIDKGVRIGVLGALHPMDNAVEELHGLVSLPLLESLGREAASLRSRGADIVVLLSHHGLDDDKRIAKALPGAIDLIVGGHSHSELHEASLEGGTIIVQAGGHGRYVGELTLDICDGAIVSHAVTLHDAEARPIGDPRQEAAMARIRADAEEALSERLFTLEADISHEGLIGLFAFVLRERMGAELGMMFGPAATEGLPAGPVTLGDLYRISKSLLTPAKFLMSGRQIRGILAERLDASIRDKAMYGVGFRPQGIPFGSIRFAGLPVTGLDDDRRYSVAAVTHMFSAEYGGYPSLDGSIDMDSARFVYLREAIAEYFRGKDEAGRIACLAAFRANVARS